MPKIIQKKKMKEMAEHLKVYIDTTHTYLFIENTPEEEYKWARKTIKKLIKELEEGKTKHIDKDNVQDYALHDEGFARDYLNPDWDGD